MPKNTTNGSASVAKTKTSGTVEYKVMPESDTESVVSDTTQITTTEVEDDVQQAADAINVISLEEVQVPDSNYKGKRQSRGSPTDDRNKNKKSTGCYPKSNNFAMKRAKELTQGTSGKYMMQPAGASEDIVRSGHIEYATLWASNDSQIGRQPVTVNVVNAPNNSTLQCGCENISCPFCNLMLSIERTDPSVLQ